MIYRDFPDVYAEEYEEGCRRFAAQLTAYRDDPLLIGYFLNNEPAWGFVEGILAGGAGAGERAGHRDPAER